MLKTVGFPSTRTGDQTIVNGNEVFATAGKGVNFTANTPAAGMTSQLLNWYEEGTFTPVIEGDSGAGTGTYTIQTGYYTRIGRQVSVQIVLAWTAHTGTGNIRVNGLPFTCNANVQAAAALQAYNLALSANNYLVGRVEQNTQYMSLLQSPTGGGAWTNVPMDTSVDALVINVTYII